MKPQTRAVAAVYKRVRQSLVEEAEIYAHGIHKHCDCAFESRVK